MQGRTLVTQKREQRQNDANARCNMSGYRGGIFVCPYYSRDYRDYLNCEGAKLTLPKEELDEYTRRYCASEEWRRCHIARALTLHYERTENL